MDALATAATRPDDEEILRLFRLLVPAYRRTGGAGPSGTEPALALTPRAGASRTEIAA